MRRVEMMTAVEREVHGVTEDCSRPVQKALAAFVVGLVLAVSAGVGAAMAATPGRAHDRSKQRRVQRLLANPNLEPPRAQRRLIARATRAIRRIDLLLDATTTGGTAAFPGLVTLVLAWRRSSNPPVWSACA